MGFAVARLARDAGHEVTLVSGPVGLTPPADVEFVRVVSAAEMFDACCETFDRVDAAVMTAAVCDYRPAHRMDRKLKKEASERTLELEPTRDICAHLGSIKGRRVVVGFAMEDHDARRHAEDKLRKKSCDAIVLNGLANVGSERASIEILTADGSWSEPVHGTKDEAAGEIVRLVERLVRRMANGE
jgi:phosphopantothenoylcysteine decarboxylase/phosphopantothenate--cysteine ligase